MADEGGETKWTEGQREKLQKWIAAKWGANKPCPQCGAVKFTYGDQCGLLVGGNNDATRVLVGETSRVR